jgi:hypothetical protein
VLLPVSRTLPVSGCARSTRDLVRGMGWTREVDGPRVRGADNFSRAAMRLSCVGVMAVMGLALVGLPAVKGQTVHPSVVGELRACCE